VLSSDKNKESLLNYLIAKSNNPYVNGLIRKENPLKVMINEWKEK
jgi:hypothetical protein